MDAPRQSEYRAVNLLEALAAGRKLPDADATAAVFRTWPAPGAPAARLLAAHANAARGRDVLWLVGVDAAGGGPGADVGRFDGWLAAMLPFFDGLAPHVTRLKVPLAPAAGKSPARTALALHVETGRAPFVVRAAGARSARLEVPWFDVATGAIRPAGRLELVKLLTPLQDIPQLEILEGDLTFYKNQHSPYSRATFRWTLDGALYLVPRGQDRVILPLHRCRAALLGAETSFAAPAAEINFTADKNSPGVRLTESAILLEGLGRIFIYCSGSTSAPELPLAHGLRLTVDLQPAGADRTATVATTMRPAQVTEGNQAGRWKL